MLRQVTSQEKIHSILTAFTPYLNSLKSGSIQKEQIAIKFHNYGIVLEIEEKDSTIAFAAFYCNDEISKLAFLSMIAVLPCARQCGYGKLLMNEVVKIARGHGMEHLKLEVRKTNLSAINFYKSLGFHMLNEERTQSLFMQKELSEEGR